jgi:hypothetical protein
VTGYAWNMPSVGNIVTGILSDLAAALAASTEKVSHVIFTPGAMPADDWCQCGQLDAWVARSYRTRTFPNDDAAVVTNCSDFKIVFDCRIRLVRCLPGADHNGNPPSDAAQTQAAVLQSQDAWVVWGTLSCILEELAEVNVSLIADWQVYDQVPVGPLGECGGTETSFRFSLIPQCCPLDKSLT